MKKHAWGPDKTSLGFWGYHKYICKNCGKSTHIGLDIDYDALECATKAKRKRNLK